MLKIAIDFLLKPHLFLPTVRVSDFSQIQGLASNQNMSVVFIDKDDTITAYRQFTLYDNNIRTTLAELRKKNVDIKILSNGIGRGDPDAVEGFQILKTKQKKPFNGEEVLQMAGCTDKEKVWFIGDRLMTDIYLANRLGCKSILVNPIERSTVSKHGLGVVVLRFIEDTFLKSKQLK